MALWRVLLFAKERNKNMDKSLKQIKPMLSPVCGEYEFEDALCHDVCPVCGWEDDGVEVDPYDKDGGPSNEFLEFKKTFLEKKKTKSEI